MNRTYLFIGISSLALIIVLIIQVNWIFKTAQIKEELFNEKANIVLSRTTEALSADQETCKKIEACGEQNSESETITNLGKDEVHKIDSLFRYHMDIYNFHIGYSFVVSNPSLLTSKEFLNFDKFSYTKPSKETVRQDKIALKLLFPEKRQFLIAEMGPMFIISVLLILVVLFMFIRTTLSLLKEKKISEHSTDFLNNMTHEFKTPLTNIALAAKMIHNHSSNTQNDKLSRYSEIILAENKKLSLQVEQVLGMTALERGEIPLRKTALNFHDIITQAFNCFSLQMEEKKGQVDFQLNAQNVSIFGDKIHLTNALCNLIDNALKYSKEPLKIILQTSNLGSNLILTFSDNGIGIDKDYQKNVFDKFFRVPTGDIHDVKGFGLGLAYVHKIIELHHGTIELQSEKEKGTTFKITIPND